MASQFVSTTVQSQSSDNQKHGLALSVLSVIFFMWGFLTCLNDILIPHLKAVFSLSYAQSALIQFTFFGAYFIVSLPAGKVVSKIGYKLSISLGLFVAALGALLFLPAAQMASYPFFLGALFVLASGITVLQVAANPYVSLLGSEKTAPSRLNLAQALNSLGTTVAPYFGSFLILTSAVLSMDQIASLSLDEQNAYKLQQAQTVQGPYLFLAGVLILLSIFIFLFKLPQFKSHDSKTQAEVKSQKVSVKEVLSHPHVAMGVLALFLYVGAEVAIGSFLINFLAEAHIGNLSESAAANYIVYYWGGAMVGRFIGSALMQKIDPSRLLGVFALVAALLTAVAIGTEGSFAMWSILAVGLFNSIMFPTIFSLGIRGLGPLTEKASSLLIMAIVGGALIPLAHGVLADHWGLQLAFVLPFACYLFIAYYGFKGSTPRPRPSPR